MKLDITFPYLSIICKGTVSYGCLKEIHIELILMVGK